ncbi:WD40 domain-containing protein, partial [Hamiltosporidium magnivora]
MPNLYTQMEKKTQRVKSVAFHHTKPILLTAHHTGTIKAYDYQTSSLIHEFNDHEGPVRTIIFHPFINIFVSGGDDCIIRIWSYNERKIITKLKGHTDYIRCLDFHPNLPWILSSSDDQTIKIWNFQSYKLLATLTGHSHYVMSAKFLTQDYIISASLDQSLRLWDCKSLKTPKNKKSIDILKVPEVIVRQILDGHEKGINWISVNPNTTMFATSSDDRQIKIWELVGEIVKERDVFHHHQGNVSSVLFVNNLLISNGEDGILCIYDLKNKKSKKIVIEDRFWCITTNRDSTLFCVGYDTGFKVFSVDRQTPLFSTLYTPTFSGIFYFSGNSLKFNNLKTERNIFTTKKEVTSIHSLGSRDNNDIDTFNNNITNTDNDIASTDNISNNISDNISDNTTDNITDTISDIRLIIQYNNTFDVLKNNKLIFSGNGKAFLSKHGILTHYNTKVSLISNEGSIIKDSILFTEEEIIFKDENIFIILKNKSVSFMILSDSNGDSQNISNNILDISDSKSNTKYNKYSKYNTHNRHTDVCFIEKNISLNFKPIYCICKQDRVAVLGNKEVSILKLKEENLSTSISPVTISISIISTTVEPVGINYGFFYKEGFIYSTKRHLKYLLNSSDTGILKSLDKQIYVFYMCNDFVFYLTSRSSSSNGYISSGYSSSKSNTNNNTNNNEFIIENTKIDFTEFEFKLSVNKNEDKKILEIIRNGKLLGLSFLSFLIKNNKGVLVLDSVSNLEQKIEILLSVGRLEECLDIIREMGGKDKQEGVNNLYNKQQGDNNSTNKQQGDNNSTNKQQGINNSTDNYHPLSNSTNKQHPINHTPTNYHPLNNSTTYITLLRRVLKEAFKRCNFTVCEKCLLLLNDTHGLFMLYICNKKINLINKIKNKNLEILVFLGNKREIERYIGSENSEGEDI